jgi:hypothetical protein
VCVAAALTRARENTNGKYVSLAHIGKRFA